MQLVPCPDGGKCGSKNHRPNGHRYKWCLHMAQMRQRSRDTKARILAQGGTITQSLSDYTKMVDGMRKERKSVAYAAADDYVTTDMVIPEEFVQAYINNPDDTNDMLREKLKDDIRDDVLSKDRDILYKLGMGIDYFSDDEIDTVIDAVLEADRSDIAGAMAKNMGPRTFSSSPITSSNKEIAFRYATNGSEIGTDKWFDTLANHYWSDLGMNGIVDPESLYAGEYHTTMEAQIRSILKDAIDKRGRAVESYEDLSDLSVVWSGSLADLSPHGKEHDRVCFVNPSLVASYSDTGAVSEPVQVDGLYDIAFNDDNRKWYHKYGSMSQVVDEMTSDKPILRSPGGEETLGKLASKASTVYDESPRLSKQYERD